MVVAQITSNQIQVSSVTLMGDTWCIDDHWCDEDIKKVKGIAESAVEPQNILARVVRLALKLSIFGFAFFLLFSFILVFPSIVVWIIYYFLLKSWVGGFGGIIFAVLWLVVFSLVLQGLKSRNKPHSKQGKKYQSRQIIDRVSLKSEYEGIGFEFKWSHICQLIDSADYIILIHEDENHFFFVSKRAFNLHTVQEFLSFCRENMMTTQSQN